MLNRVEHEMYAFTDEHQMADNMDKINKKMFKYNEKQNNKNVKRMKMERK